MSKHERTKEISVVVPEIWVGRAVMSHGGPIVHVDPPGRVIVFER